MAESTDLRARRRRQTTQDIHDAALRLARERGYDNVTIEQISAEAGVSQRTFFNYFPTKEAAVVYAPLEISDELAAEFISRGKARRSVVLTDLISLIAEHFDQQPPSRRQHEDIKMVALQHPNVLAAVLTTFEQFYASVAEIVARRLRLQADDEVPQLIAGLALATVRTGLEMWSRDAPTEPDTPVPYIHRAASLLRSFFGNEDRTADTGRPRRPPTRRKPSAKAAPQ
ncbi:MULTISPECIES: TetR family transcriptional regulator [unclassified Mycobacterium]|uniref:TetR family transcriptional regulator n=1 Tax=unclassified Mycobacterium TaxID=2642494 RepID=UPI0029C74ED5|nr:MULTISPECIES: TetR family transcriptional regulator [unclassified Mycobacterium]